MPYKNKIAVYITFPPFPTKEYHLNQQHIDSLYSIMRDIKLPLLTRPEDTVYPTSHFADTVYHLNEEGEKHRSQKLLDHLLKIIH